MLNGTNLSHIKEKHIIEKNKANLTTRVSQNNGGGHLLKVVVKEGRNDKGNDQHYDEVLERCQREIKLLEYLQK